ncbi:MAG: APC family permease [Nibricoccus sp.]
MSLKTLFIGKARSLSDSHLFHKVSLIAVFAWVGLGADGLSSSCYGPEETFKALGACPALAIFVAAASIVTITAICASYSQIISLFPSGGGGYLVASKLLSPAAGVVSGSALLIDYVLTVAISVASGADALFSILPPGWLAWKLSFAFLGVVALTLINLRGVKESVMLWVPAFFLFIGTHAAVIVYAIVSHVSDVGTLARETVREVHTASSQLGWFGLLAVLLKAYSMGAGTYTGIEAVSNGLPILREPRVKTGRRTMFYMGLSLAVTAAGLLLAYLFFRVEPVDGKTLNAVLLEKMTADWGNARSIFVWITLAAEAALLFIAAQAGFLDGPRILANMALDRWLPTRFANLSDRFVTQNGVLLIGGAALAVMAFTRGHVATLVVLYSINVFITFSLSQLGMVRHWWKERRNKPLWRSKLAINGFGLALTLGILVALTMVKFFEGGWITLAATGLLVVGAFAVKRHYRSVNRQLERLDLLVTSATDGPQSVEPVPLTPDTQARTAILLVNGYNGLGLHTLLNIPRVFGDSFRNYVFLQIGAVDAGNFKGADELAALRVHVDNEVARYVAFARSRGYSAEGVTAIATDVVGEIVKSASQLKERYPNSVFFGGQLLFKKETRLTRWLHNSTAFILQRRFFLANLPYVVLPIRVNA